MKGRTRCALSASARLVWRWLRGRPERGCRVAAAADAFARKMAIISQQGTLAQRASRRASHAPSPRTR